jgi:predicted alpha/beta-hydrolase family hydrolase
VVLWPGSGADRDHRTLVAIEERLVPLPVLRCDHAHRTAGRKVPGKPGPDIDGVVDTVRSFASDLGVPTSSLVIGGRSYGGRICSLAVADGLDVGGLLLLSYPLHPPGKPDRLRTDHFAALRSPTLFVSGQRDPFGSPDEFAPWFEALGTPPTVVWVAGAHAPADDSAVADAVASWISS